MPHLFDVETAVEHVKLSLDPASGYIRYRDAAHLVIFIAVGNDPSTCARSLTKRIERFVANLVRNTYKDAFDQIDLINESNRAFQWK